MDGWKSHLNMLMLVETQSIFYPKTSNIFILFEYNTAWRASSARPSWSNISLTAVLPITYTIEKPKPLSNFGNIFE